MAQVVRVSHVTHARSERHSSTLSSPFHSTSSSSHFPSISRSPCCSSSTSLRTVVTLCTPPTRRWCLLRSPTSTQVMSPRTTTSWRLVSSPSQSLHDQPQFPEQRFLEDVDYDDTAPEEMLHNEHRVHVYHPHSPCWRSSTGFPRRSGCRAQSTARSGGSRRRRTGRKR